MSDNVNLYRVLGVPSDSTHAEIKVAYRLLARGLHPDKHDDSDKERLLAEINKAYHVLGSPASRQEYDDNRVLDKSSDFDINSKAMQIVVEKVTEILMGEERINEDISQYLINMSEQAHVNHSMMKESIKSKISKFTKNRDRVLSRNDTSDSIILAMNKVIEDSEGKLRELDVNIKIGDRIIELAKDLDILKDEVPMASYTTSIAVYNYS